MNITIIIVVLMYVIIGMGVIRQRAFWIIVVAILFFMILVGDQSSAWRAAVMGIIFLYAQKIGRPRGVPNAILMAAVIMVAINPRVLLYDVGFQLSFAAFAGLLYVAPVLEKYFFHMPAWGNMKESFITTLSAQIATLPLLLFYFHSFSLIALVTNSLILPIVPFLTVWGIANAGVGLFSFVLGRVMGFVSWLGISYILYITHIMTKIPYASVAWPLGGAGLLFMYAIIIWVVSINREKINNEE